jgi:GT2 family glycosyltransferase
MTIRAVVVNFERYDLVESCLRALEASSCPPDEIVVIDNQADERALAGLARGHPSLVTVANRDNRGYATACNQGAAGAQTEYLLFINPDVTVPPDCLEWCVRAADGDQRIGIVTPRLTRPDGRLDHACHRGIPTPMASLAYALRLNRRFPNSRRLARYTMSWLDPLTDHDIEACSGAFMLVRRSDFERVGGWDERYWFYAEDLDLCVRIGKLGKVVRYLGSASALHIKGASSGLHSRSRRPDRAERARIRALRSAIVRSHSLFFREHLEETTAPPVSIAVKSMFYLQGLRIRAWGRLDAVRGGD